MSDEMHRDTDSHMKQEGDWDSVAKEFDWGFDPFEPVTESSKTYENGKTRFFPDRFQLPNRRILVPYNEKTGVEVFSFFQPGLFTEMKVLKVISCEDSPGRWEKALRECQLMNQLRGRKGILWLYDCEKDESNRIVFLLMEWAQPLKEYLSRRMISRTDLVRIGTGICDALLQCKAAGIAHLDVHPGNLYYDDKILRLGDFSSAVKCKDRASIEVLTGTPAFMAPEVYRENRYSEQSDLYSVGMVLYWILNFSMPPFRPLLGMEEAMKLRMDGVELPVPQFVMKHPEEFKELYACIKKACAFRPEDRYATLEEMRNVLALVGYEYFTNPGTVSFQAGLGDYEPTIYESSAVRYTDTV